MCVYLQFVGNNYTYFLHTEYVHNVKTRRKKMKKYLLKSNFLIIIALEEISANLANCWIFGKQIEAKFFNNCYLNYCGVARISLAGGLFNPTISIALIFWPLLKCNNLGPKKLLESSKLLYQEIKTGAIN